MTNDIKCYNCENYTEKLSDDVITLKIQELNNNLDKDKWVIDDNAILLKKKFKNFKQSLNFVNEISEIAENMQHHPDIYFGWGYCNVRILTHKINNLTEFDFLMASKINSILNKKL